MRPYRRRVDRVLAVLAVAWCATATPAGAADDATLTVFAAASLSGAFGEMTTAFESAHPGAKVALNLAGSPMLLNQIREGAPADVFASADEATMQNLVDAGAVAGAPRIFAANLLQIVVAKGNPNRISRLADLARPGLVVVLCGETVPCGRYALEAFRKAGVVPPAASQELDVKAVLTKVVLGEADAGIVYLTDVRAAGDVVEGVPLPPEHEVRARYPIAALRAAPNAAAAQKLIAFVLSDAGANVLARHGFSKP
jgi:molybdate transport system substrate-binding protein